MTYEEFLDKLKTKLTKPEWIGSVQKKPLSRNITIDEWNQLVTDITHLANDDEAIVAYLKTITDNFKEYATTTELSDVSDVANSAYVLAETANQAVGERTVAYVLTGFEEAVFNMFSDYVSYKNGDILVLSSKYEPDFVVTKAKNLVAPTIIHATDYLNLPTPNPGDMFKFVDDSGTELDLGLLAIESGINVPEIQIDTFLSLESVNPVQNKVITEALEGKVNTSDVVDYAQVGESRPITSNHVKNELIGLSKYVDVEVARVESIAKGANAAVSFRDYKEMVDAFKDAGADTYKTNQNVMILDLGVPDLWVSGVMESYTDYGYVDDDTIVETLFNPNYGAIRVGYYYLSALETQKVNLENYPTKNELSTALAGKLNAVTPNKWAVYVYNPDKNIQDTVGLDYPNDANVNNIPRRYLKGSIYIPDEACTAIEGGKSAVNQNYVDNAIANVTGMRVETFSPMLGLTVENNVSYVADSPVNTLYINYPEGNFICSVQFTTASSGVIAIYLPNTSKFIGGTPTFSYGETIELNIRNGIVAWGKIQ